MDDYDQYYFDDAVGGTEGGYSGTQEDYDSNFTTGSITGTNDYDMNFDNYLQDSTNWDDTRTFDQYDFNTGDYTGPTASMSMGDTGMSNPLEGAGDTLAKLFSNPSLLAKGIGALFEGQQNRKMGKSMNSIAERPAFDPFASQRPFYQQQMQNTVQDPYSQPIVKAQADQLARAQRIIDAKAGRRSNMATSAPGVLAAQAAIAQKYMDSLQRPAGAYLGPDSGSLAKLLSQGADYNTQGSVSPLLQVLGNATRTNDNQSQLEQLARILKGG